MRIQNDLSKKKTKKDHHKPKKIIAADRPHPNFRHFIGFLDNTGYEWVKANQKFIFSLKKNDESSPIEIIHSAKFYQVQSRNSQFQLLGRCKTKRWVARVAYFGGLKWRNAIEQNRMSARNWAVITTILYETSTGPTLRGSIIFFWFSENASFAMVQSNLWEVFECIIWKNEGDWSASNYGKLMLCYFRMLQ